jgi:hypothetical protein
MALRTETRCHAEKSASLTTADIFELFYTFEAFVFLTVAQNAVGKVLGVILGNRIRS